MARNISDSTLSIARTSIKNRLQNLEDVIRQVEEQRDNIPSWMIELRNSLIDAIDELDHLL